MRSTLKDKVYYGWVVVTALAVITFIMMGLNSSFGVFFRSLEDAYGLSRATTSSVLSVRMAFGSLFAFLGGWAIDRYGSRVVFFIMGLFVGASLVLTGLTAAAWQLFITYSVLLAVGVGGVYVVTSSTILRWFSRRRGLALGIAGSGGGLGMVLMAPLTAFLIESLDWRKSLLILGGVGWLVILPISRLMTKPPHETEATADGDARSPGTQERVPGHVAPPLLRVLGTNVFWLFLSIWVLMAFGMFFVLTHIVPHATDLGFSAVESATILSLTGVGMVAGRFIAGVAADRVSAKRTAILCAGLQVGALLWVVQMQQLWMLYLFGLIFGFTQGGISVATTILVGEAFELSRIGKILGLLEIGFSAGAAAGPFVGGLIFDVTGEYGIAFLITAAAVLAQAFLMALIKRAKRNGP